MKRKSKSGFTLLELIVVIGIIALLVAMVVPRYRSSKLNAMASSHNANIRTMKSAASMYLTEDGADEGNILDGVLAYIEGGELPDIPAEVSESNGGVKEWSITVQDGEVIIKPGEVKVVDGKMVLVD